LGRLLHINYEIFFYKIKFFDKFHGKFVLVSMKLFKEQNKNLTNGFKCINKQSEKTRRNFR